MKNLTFQRAMSKFLDRELREKLYTTKHVTLSEIDRIGISIENDDY